MNEVIDNDDHELMDMQKKKARPMVAITEFILDKEA